MDYFRAKKMHQFYRDVFTREITITETGKLPVLELEKYTVQGQLDFFGLCRSVLSADSGLPETHDKGLKSLLLAVVMANLSLDKSWQGKQVILPEGLKSSLNQALTDAITRHPCIEYLEAVIQLLFRVGDIESVVSLVGQNSEYLKSSAKIVKIMLMLAVIEENFDLALSLVKTLTADSQLMGEDAMALLLTVTTIYKCGGTPESFIDFRSLRQKMSFPADAYNIEFAPACNNDRTTVVVCCDPVYYAKHAVPLVYSIFDTNNGLLNVHLHVYNITDAVRTDVARLRQQFPELNISCTSEIVSVAENIVTHYASRRFIFAEYALKALKTPVLIVDADCLFRKSWQDIMPRIAGMDLLLNKPEIAPFWESVCGGFVWLGGGNTSKSYIGKVRKFLLNNLHQNNAVWFLDQMALSAVASELAAMPGVATIPGSYAIDIEHTDHSFTWVVTTIKHAQGRYNDYKTALCAEFD